MHCSQRNVAQQGETVLGRLLSVDTISGCILGIIDRCEGYLFAFHVSACEFLHGALIADLDIIRRHIIETLSTGRHAYS